MLTAGIAMVGGGQGKPLLLPAASEEDQGALAEGFFAKSMGELISGSAGTKTQLSMEQAAGAEKKDVLGANDLTEAGSEISEAGEIPVSPSMPRVVATHVPVAFGDEGLQVAQTTTELGQPVTGASAIAPLQGDIEKAVAAAGTVAPQVVANVAVLSKETTSGKLQTKAEHTETKRETRKANKLAPDANAMAEVVSLNANALPPALAIATVPAGITLPVNIDMPVSPKVETGVASAKGSSAGSKINGPATGIVAAAGTDRGQRGREMSAGAIGAHSVTGHSQNIETDVPKGNVSSTSVSNEVVVKPQGAGAGTTAATAVAAPVVTVDGSMGAQGAVQKLSSVVGHDSGLRTDAVGAAVALSQEATGGDALLVNDGHRMLSATPTSLEVGVANGSSGWLKIRAELTDGGAVNASVSAASSAGQEMLHRELPSLTAYLQSEGLGVNTVAVHATAATTGTHDFSGAMSGGGQSQMQQGGSSQSGDARQGLVATDSDRMEEQASSAVFEGAGSSALSSTAYGEGGSGGGGWLSVMA